MKDNKPPVELSRRQMLVTGAASAAAAVNIATPVRGSEPVNGNSKFHTALATAQEPHLERATETIIKQSIVRWCYNQIPLERLAQAAVEMGVGSIELVAAEELPILREHGLICALGRSHGFVRGLNNPANHPECVEALRQGIESAAEFGCPNVITFSGLKVEGIDDQQGIANTVTAIRQVIDLAEERGVNIALEPLNTRVEVEMRGHPGYQCDTLEWALEVCQQVDSPRMKILFDLYHTQVMQGDLISRIREHHQWICHYHTAGVPGRGDLNAAQELNYPALMNAIAETGYTGFVGQEFIPEATDEAGQLAALRHAVQLCDI